MNNKNRSVLVVVLLLGPPAFGVSAATSCPTFRDPDYKVTAWDKNDALGCSQADARLAEVANRARTNFPVLAEKLDRVRSEAECPRRFADVGPQPSTFETGLSEWPVILTKLIVQRAENELRMALKDSFLNDICSDDADVRAYFPSTCRLYETRAGFNVLPSDAQLSRTFSNDMRGLPACLIYQIRQPKIASLPEGKPSDKGYSAGMGYVLVNLLEAMQDKQAPQPLVAGLANSPAVKGNCKVGTETICGLYFGGIAVSARLNAGDSREWIPLYFYERLLRQGGGLTDEQIYRRADLVVRSGLLKKTEALIVAVDGAEKAKQSFDNVPADDAHRDERLEVGYQLSLKVLDLLDAATCPTRSQDEHRECLAGDLRPSLKRAYTLTKVVIQAQQHRYDEMTAELRPVLKCLEGPGQAGCEEWDPWAQAITEHSQHKTITRLGKNLLFAGALASAKTDEDAVAILDQYASPVGSWRLKRDKSVVSFGAMLGFAGGGEVLSASGYQDQSGYYGGLLVPVGLDFSWPGFSFFNLYKCPGCSNGVFFSMLDVGPLVSTTSANDGNFLKVDANAQVGTSQLFSPGVYYRVGLGKTPFVAGAGISYTRGLREATAPDGTIQSLDSTRYLLFVAVDVMLMKFGR